MKRILVIGSL